MHIEYCIIVNGEFCEKIYTDYNEVLNRLSRHRAISVKNGTDPTDIGIGYRIVTDWCECKEKDCK